MNEKKDMEKDQGVVLVTGASAGIGRATSDRLHQAGWTVVGASRRGTTSGGWSAMIMDVDNDESVVEGVASLTDQYGHIDAVVTCAGWGLAGPVEHTSIADAKDQMETNFWGTVRVVREVLPTMRKQGHGRIIAISSLGGIIGIPFQAFYSASKFALEGYAESLAYEIERFGIRVTLVEPGNVSTDFTSSRRDVKSADADKTYREAVAKAVGKMVIDEQRGVSSDAVAMVVQRILNTKNPARRVSVGALDERIGLLGKRLLPYRLFEKAARSSLGV